MGLAALSLSGIPPLAGFWSKDEVLAAASTGAGPILLAFGVITVFLTAFYTFRMFFLTFHGQFRGIAEAAEVEHRHSTVLDAESHVPAHTQTEHTDWWMVGPLVILAIPTVLVGLWGSPFGNYGFQRFLEGAQYQDIQANLPLAVVGIVLALAGILAAWMLYGARAFVREPLVRFGGVYTLLARRYYIDELYMRLIDIFAIGVGAALAVFDRQLLDGIVNGVAEAFRAGGRTLRGVQTGRVQNYGLVLFGGLAVIAIVLVVGPALATRP
jgi:NADH-quinone oxidoreductase subunit L